MFLATAKRKGVKTRAPVVAYKDADLSRTEALAAEADRLKMVNPAWKSGRANRQAETNIRWMYGKSQ